MSHEAAHEENQMSQGIADVEDRLEYTPCSYTCRGQHVTGSHICRRQNVAAGVGDSITCSRISPGQNVTCSHR
jgi:hypothetical protein